MNLASIELVSHPESEVEPLKLEELLSSVKDTLSFEIVYTGKYIRIYLIGHGEVLRNLRKSLKTIYGKVIIEEANPPSLKSLLVTSKCLEHDERKQRYRIRRGCSWYVAELRLYRPFWNVLISHSEKKPLEVNPIDVILANMKPNTYVQIIFTPEPSGRSVIADWVLSKTTGRSTSVAKQIIKDLSEMLNPASVTSDRPYPYYEYEREYYRLR